MADAEDLKLAADEGIISQDQLKQLGDFFAKQQQKTFEDVSEAPRFLTSFNDIFLSLGVLIFAIALAYIVGIYWKVTAIELFSQEVIGYRGKTRTAHLQFIPIIIMPILALWGLAEWMTGRLRANFPSMCLVLAIGLFAFWSFKATGHFYKSDARSWTYILGSLFAMFTTCLFYWRFRLPFALWLIAGSFAILIPSIAYAIDPKIPQLGLNAIIFLIGASIFALAMWFDLKDPKRQTRASDNGFWLHILAAPLMTHAVLGTQFSFLNLFRFLGRHKAIAALDSSIFLIVVPLFMFLAFVALLIDRRAMLMAGLGYIAVTMGYFLNQLLGLGEIAAPLSLLLVAALIFILGTRWHPIRRWLFSKLPSWAFLKKLPPLRT